MAEAVEAPVIAANEGEKDVDSDTPREDGPSDFHPITDVRTLTVPQGPGVQRDQVGPPGLHDGDHDDRTNRTGDVVIAFVFLVVRHSYLRGGFSLNARRLNILVFMSFVNLYTKKQAIFRPVLYIYHGGLTHKTFSHLFHYAPPRKNTDFGQCFYVPRGYLLSCGFTWL